MPRNPAAKVARKFRRQARRARRILVEGIQSKSGETRTELRLDSPIDTGHMQDSWKYRKLKTGAKFVNSAHYAIFDKKDKGARFGYFYNDVKQNALKGAQSAAPKLGSLGATYGR